MRVLGIRSELTLDLQAGAYILPLGQVTYVITQGCTGLFTSTLLIIGVLTYPTDVKQKLIGLLLCIPAFFIFGVLRVVIMGVVAVTYVSHVEIFHVYVMAIANLGFAVYVWLFWYNNVVKSTQTD